MSTKLFCDNCNDEITDANRSQPFANGTVGAGKAALASGNSVFFVGKPHSPINDICTKCVREGVVALATALQAAATQTVAAS